MEIPRLTTEIPRYSIAARIRDYLAAHQPGAPLPDNPGADALIALYNGLNARDRAVVYRVALSLAEHAAEEV